MWFLFQLSVPSCYFLNYDSNQVLCFACITNLLLWVLISQSLLTASSLVSNVFCCLLSSVIYPPLFKCLIYLYITQPHTWYSFMQFSKRFFFYFFFLHYFFFSCLTLRHELKISISYKIVPVLFLRLTFSLRSVTPQPLLSTVRINKTIVPTVSRSGD